MGPRLPPPPSSYHGEDDPSLTTMGTPPLVAPIGFRPNTHFVGFDIEMARLTKKLSREQRDEPRSKAVLLHGPPGSGKSHLARQYLWQHINEYANGIFWIDCKTNETLMKGFWNIAQALQCSGGDENAEPNAFIDAVRRQLSQLDKWLIVFDSIYFSLEEQLDDFTRFIPPTNGTIIYTTINGTLSNRTRLLDPAGIKIYPLSTEQGCALLFKILHMKDGQQASALQLKKANQLVKHYEGLPLGIHAAAHALLARGRPLEKFQPGPSDQRLSLPFLSILDTMKQSQQTEAVNMLQLLCFMAHEVPVAMLRFGQSALSEAGVEIRSADTLSSDRRELDSTIAILIRYGLIARRLQTRQGGSAHIRGSKEAPGSPPPAIGIDMLCMHSVVQQVYLDHMKSQSEVDFGTWLTISVRFLIRIWDVTYTRILAMSEPHQIIADLREFEGNAEKMWQHFPSSPTGVSQELRKARHDLHALRRTIKSNIEQQTEIDQGAIGRSSVFDLYDDEYDDEGPDTPLTSLTRAPTWALDPTGSEPDTQIMENPFAKLAPPLEDEWYTDPGPADEDEDPHPKKTIAPDPADQALSERQRQQALRAIFKGTVGKSETSTYQARPATDPHAGPAAYLGPDSGPDLALEALLAVSKGSARSKGTSIPGPLSVSRHSYVNLVEVEELNLNDKRFVESSALHTSPLLRSPAKSVHSESAGFLDLNGQFADVAQPGAVLKSDDSAPSYEDSVVNIHPDGRESLPPTSGAGVQEDHKLEYREESSPNFQDDVDEGPPINGQDAEKMTNEIQGALAFTDSGYETMQQAMSSLADSKAPGQDLFIGGDSHDDALTNYSIDSIDIPQDDLVEDFSQQLFADLQAKNLNRDEFDEQFYGMEEVLLDFALRLGHVGSSVDLLKAQKFVHRHRNALSKCFERNFLQDVITHSEEDIDRRSDSSYSQNERRTPGPQMGLDAKMKMWESKTSTEATHEFERYDEYIDPMDEIKKAVYKSAAYTWLVKSLSGRSLLVNSNPEILLAITKSLKDAVPRPRHISRRIAVPACCVVYETEWPLRAFLDDQWPMWHDTGWIGEIVTLTGADVDAQAMSCEAYLKQTWPLIGSNVLRLVDSSLRTKGYAQCKLFDETQVTAHSTGDRFVFRVEGVRGTVVEVGEQLCWLVCALRTPTMLGIVTPVCHKQSQPPGDQNVPASFTISFELRPVEADDTKQGTCWHSLFGSAGIVCGYPILRRMCSGSGLELPLTIAAALIGARYLARHDNIDKIQSSGASMFPKERVDDTILWHLEIVNDEARVPYIKCAVEALEIDQPVVNFERHIVGWSEQARHHIGSLDCNYEIGVTRTRQVDTTCALHTSVLSPATPIPRDQPFHILKDQYPPYHIPHELPTIMRRMGRRFVCFWDVDERRGWLTDGMAALAHLVRGSIASDKSQTPEFMQLEVNPLHEPSDSKRPTAPSAFLCHVSNQQIPILAYPHKGEVKSESFEDRVVQSYHLLDSAFAYQEKAKKIIKGSPRTLLEGWDFHDLTWRRDDPHNARFTSLEPKARGWVDLLREIGAITIFGQGFGELIEPITDVSRPLCTRWTTLPSGSCYMAASQAVLQKIALHHGGNILASPARLTSRTSLVVPANTFTCCGCGESESISEPVQIFWPTKKLNLLDHAHSLGTSALRGRDGALVFGHNKIHDWHWPDHGGPERGPPPLVPIEDGDSDSDTSIELSILEGATDSLPSRSVTTPNTSVSAPDRSVSQLSKHHENIYGNTEVGGDGRLIMGNVYITNNNTVTATDIDHTSYHIPKLPSNEAEGSRPLPTVQEEHRLQKPYSCDEESPPATRNLSTGAAEPKMKDHAQPGRQVNPELMAGDTHNRSRWTISRIGIEVARSISQPWLDLENKRK